MKKHLLLGMVVLAAPLLLGLCLLTGAAGIGLPDMATATGRAVFSLRLNRVLAGFVVGAGLSCAGAVLQALLRNPLAEPYVLGVSSGAGLGAASAILSGLAAGSVFATPLAAFAGGCVTLALVHALAWSGGRISMYGLILSGVVVSSVCASLLMFLVTMAPVEGLHSVLWWMLGSLEVASGPLFAVSALLILPGVLVIWLLTPELNALTLGQELAHHLGVRTRAVISLGLVLATLITAAAVGLAGLIGFVGLIVPHSMRHLLGPDHRRLIPAAALAGGAFLAVCDAVARTVMAPVEIPVGVVTALIGGPFFLVLLQRRKRRGWVE
jgi:iron complex transport system permease protein